MKHLRPFPIKRVAIALATMVMLAACSEPVSTPQPPTAEPPVLTSLSDADCGASPLPVQTQKAYQDADGFWWVFGQVQNSTYQDVPLARLCIKFNQNGQPQVREWLLDTSMQSGEVVPFRAVLQDKSIPADAQIVVTAQIDERMLGRSNSYRHFDTSVTLTPQNADKMQFSGTIRNEGNQAASDIRIVIAIYDSANSLIGVANGRVSSLGALNPGEETIFTANASKLFGTMDHYKVLVEGDIAEDADNADGTADGE